MTPAAAHRERAAVQVEQSAPGIGAGGQHPLPGHAVDVHRADLHVAEVRAIAEAVELFAQDAQPVPRRGASLGGCLEFAQQFESFVMSGAGVARPGVFHVPGLVVPRQVLAAQGAAE